MLGRVLCSALPEAVSGWLAAEFTVVYWQSGPASAVVKAGCVHGLSQCSHSDASQNETWSGFTWAADRA